MERFFCKSRFRFLGFGFFGFVKQMERIVRIGIRLLFPRHFYNTFSVPLYLSVWSRYMLEGQNSSKGTLNPNQVSDWIRKTICPVKPVFHFNRIVTYRRIFFCVEVISSTLVVRKQRNTLRFATLRYDTVEVENRLYTIPDSHRSAGHQFLLLRGEFGT
jgi:hypothetical protein